MRKSRYTEEQIIRVIQEDVNEARRLKELELENRRLKAAVADLTLREQALKDALSRKW